MTQISTKNDNFCIVYVYCCSANANNTEGGAVIVVNILNILNFSYIFAKWPGRTQFKVNKYETDYDKIGKQAQRIIKRF